MCALKELGLEFSAISGKGYCLARPLEWLEETAIRRELSQTALSALADIEIHDELDSTNTRLMGLAAAS